LTALEEFQNRYGRDWGELIGSPAFAAGLAVAREEKLKTITDFTDSEIVSKGQIVLADLRGFLQYESGLLGLHEKKELVFQQLGPEEYPSPVDEARDEALREEQERAGISTDTGPMSPNVHESIFPTAPKKPRGRPPKRKKKK
jgi:hypothetical protein